MKKSTVQTLAIIVICLAACFAGCKTSVVEAKPKKNVTTIALIKYESGMVQKIKDSFHIAKVGDTVIVMDYSALQPDASVLNREYIWGFQNADHITPKNVNEDSLYVEFNKVVVLSTFHQCYDPTHVNCDGGCICDGMECPKE